MPSRMGTQSVECWRHPCKKGERVLLSANAEAEARMALPYGTFPLMWLTSRAALTPATVSQLPRAAACGTRAECHRAGQGEHSERSPAEHALTASLRPGGHGAASVAARGSRLSAFYPCIRARHRPAPRARPPAKTAPRSAALQAVRRGGCVCCARASLPRRTCADRGACHTAYLPYRGGC